MGEVSGSVRLGRKGVLVFALAAVALLAAPPAAAAERNAYTVTPLVSDNGVPGTTVDPNLVNAWGLVAGPTSPWWVNAADADKSLLYNAAGGELAPGGPRPGGAPGGRVPRA